MEILMLSEPLYVLKSSYYFSWNDCVDIVVSAVTLITLHNYAASRRYG